MTEGARVVEQADLDANPILAEMGAVVGDSLVVEKAEAASTNEEKSDEESSDEKEAA